MTPLKITIPAGSYEAVLGTTTRNPGFIALDAQLWLVCAASTPIEGAAVFRNIGGEKQHVTRTAVLLLGTLDLQADKPRGNHVPILGPPSTKKTNKKTTQTRRLRPRTTSAAAHSYNYLFVPSWRRSLDKVGAYSSHGRFKRVGSAMLGDAYPNGVLNPTCLLRITNVIYTASLGTQDLTVPGTLEMILRVVIVNIKVTLGVLYN